MLAVFSSPYIYEIGSIYDSLFTLIGKLRQRELKWLAQTQSWSSEMRILPRWPDFSSHTGCIGGNTMRCKKIWRAVDVFIILTVVMVSHVHMYSYFVLLLLFSCKRKERKWKSFSRVRPFVTPWTIQFLKFSGSEYWSGKLFPSPGDLPNPGIKPRPPAVQVNSLPISQKGSPRILERVAYPFSRGSLQPRNRSRWILYQLR